MSSAARPSQRKYHWFLSPAKVAVVYALAGFLWILFSDQVLWTVVRDPSAYARFQTYKGWVFVGLSAALIFWLVYRDTALVRRSEEVLIESQRRLETLLANLPGMAYRCRNDPDWTMEFVSQGCFDLTGYHPSALIHNDKVSYGELILPQDRDSVWGSVQGALRDKQPFQITYRIKTAEGKEKWVWEQGRGVYGADGELLALEGIISDLTQQKTLEEQFRQAQKMEAVGRLAGGVAHDFNNLLGVIMGYAELLLGRLGARERERKHIEEIYRAGERATALTRQLLAFSRRQVIQPRVLDLNAVVTGMAKMIRRLIGEDVEVKFALDGGLGKVMADPGQIEQILMNLVVNARDAMPAGGTLTIETSNVELDEGYARWHAGVKPGGYVMLAVTDTGVGMDVETQSRLFEPFFTTKPEGKGTGLGLTTVYGIVQQGDGHIWVYSEPGHGSSFKVYLPQVTEAAEVATEEAAVAVLPQGSETVLVVEDAEPLLRLTCEMLESAGFKVVPAVTGAEALEKAGMHSGPIHLLLTDVVLPGMTGKELAERLTSTRPELRIVYVSGYPGATFNNARLLGDGVSFLQKPFTRFALLKKVRTVLDSS